MRALLFLSNRATLLILQQLVSIWFLYDFFLARDSLTVNTLWPKQERGNAQPIDWLEDLTKEVELKYCPNGYPSNQPVFDKVVFVVIDALGSNFIPSIKSDSYKRLNNSHVAMPFLENALHQNSAMGFTALATTPTVTMPRIKALLSGTIPSFVDIMYNLATDVSNFQDDNILRIAKAHNKSLVFYGDDTWLALFERDIFKRSRETHSFFASDHTTVDTNVTELALPETKLNPIDWDFLILHYLGLDHIGHVFGSNEAPLIKEKLLEMDFVIKEIHDNMAAKEHKTLMIICGDHGMSEVGNHGGDSELEASTAMIFIPIGHDIKQHTYSLEDVKIKQIDLAVTLSLLTNLPIPNRSKGVAIERLLHNLALDDVKFSLPCAGFANLVELARLMKPEEINETSQKQVLLQLLNRHLKNDTAGLAEEYLKLSRKFQSNLIKTVAASSDPTYLIVGLVSVTFLTLLNLRRTSIRLLLPVMKKSDRMLYLIIFMVPILMHGSTDFIEAEHIFWPIYTLVCALLLIGIALARRPELMDELEVLRVWLAAGTFVITTLWNNVRLFKNESGYILPLLSVAILSNTIGQNSDLKKFNRASANFITLLLIPLTKYVEESSRFDDTAHVFYRATLQRVSLICVVAHCGFNIASSPKDSFYQGGSSTIIRKLGFGWISLCFLFARSHNFLYLISNVIMETSINSIADTLRMSVVTRTILYVNFAQCAFYNQGNSNLFSTIDIMPAFYGQTNYNLYLSVPLVAMATFSTQIYWFLKMFQRIQGSKRCTGDLELTSSDGRQLSPDVSIEAARDFVTMRNFLSLSYYMFVCLVLKNHLFIWSVLSPKLVYHFTSNNVLMFTSLTISMLHHVAGGTARRQSKRAHEMID